MDIDGAILALIGGTEIMWITVAVLILFGAKQVPELMEGVKLGGREFWQSAADVHQELRPKESGLVAEALTCDNQTAEFLLQSQEESEVVKPEDLMSKLISSKSQFIVWVAQGFGIGRIPFAPGTWGSMLGVVWSVLLLRYCSPALFASVIVLSSLLAVWICGEAEKILGVSDPGSVVLDEIVAMPLAYFGVELLAARSAGDWGLGLFDRPTSPVEPTPGLLLLLAIGFGLFRLFDIWKPWPIRRLQYLPGGWGVVVDDLAAALVAGLIFLLGLAAVLPILAPPTK